MRPEKDVTKTNITTVVGTDGGEAVEKKWIAALVRMNCERKVATNLNDLGYETFVPVRIEEHKWSDRIKKIAHVVIPMIVFVHIEYDKCRLLAEHAMIYKLLRYPGAPSDEPASVIPDSQISNLRILLAKTNSEIYIEKSLKKGDEINITKGPLRGLSGVLCDIDDKNPIVGIRLNGLGYACTRIDKKYLS